MLVDVLVNPVMTDRNLFLRFRPPTHLLRAPVLSKQLFDRVPDGISDPIVNLALTAFISQALGLFRAIAAKAGITFELTTDGGFIAAQYHGDLRLVMTGFQRGGNLVSFCLGKLFVTQSAPLAWRLE